MEEKKEILTDIDGNEIEIENNEEFSSMGKGEEENGEE